MLNIYYIVNCCILQFSKIQTVRCLIFQLALSDIICFKYP